MFYYIPVRSFLYWWIQLEYIIDDDVHFLYIVLYYDIYILIYFEVTLYFFIS